MNETIKITTKPEQTKLPRSVAALKRVKENGGAYKTHKGQERVQRTERPDLNRRERTDAVLDRAEIDHTPETRRAVRNGRIATVAAVAVLGTGMAVYNHTEQDRQEVREPARQSSDNEGYTPVQPGEPVVIPDSLTQPYAAGGVPPTPEQQP